MVFFQLPKLTKSIKMNELLVIIYIGLLVLIILVFRLLGAWMFRINDVISELRTLNRKVRKIHDDLTSSQSTSNDEETPK